MNKHDLDEAREYETRRGMCAFAQIIIGGAGLALFLYIMFGMGLV